jgi:hypothetical protein
MAARACAVALVFVAGTVAACGSGAGHSSHPPVDADCAAAIRFHGHLYWGRAVTEPIPYGRTLGPGVIPSCQDGGGPGAKATVRAVRGQDPRAVVANDRQPFMIYLHDRRAPLPAGLTAAR